MVSAISNNPNFSRDNRQISIKRRDMRSISTSQDTQSFLGEIMKEGRASWGLDLPLPLVSWVILGGAYKSLFHIPT